MTLSAALARSITADGAANGTRGQVAGPIIAGTVGLVVGAGFEIQNAVTTAVQAELHLRSRFMNASWSASLLLEVELRPVPLQGIVMPSSTIIEPRRCHQDCRLIGA